MDDLIKRSHLFSARPSTGPRRVSTGPISAVQPFLPPPFSLCRLLFLPPQPDFSSSVFKRA